VVGWYQQEIERLQAAGGPAEAGAPAVDWKTFEIDFLRPHVTSRHHSGATDRARADGR
jgi:hypothetical protein